MKKSEPEIRVGVSDDGLTIVHDPGNEIKHVEEVWAFLSVDDNDKTEGIIGMMTPRGWLPLIAADAERLTKLMPYVEGVVAETGTTVRLVKFTKREEVKIFEPKNKQG